MDFQLYARVLWRFRLLFLLGLMLALALASLSIVRVSSEGLTYRQSELWSSTMRVGVTQKGFPWGRLFALEPTQTDNPNPPQDSDIPVADPNRLNNLAVLYAELAMSDQVRTLMRQEGGPVVGQIMATPLVRGEARIPLPLIDVTAVSTSPLSAIQLAKRNATALGAYVRLQQRENSVPTTDRVVVEPIMSPRRATVYQPRSKTIPIVVFLAVMFGTCGLAFLLENVRPRPSEPPAADEARHMATRRTA